MKRMIVKLLGGLLVLGMLGCASSGPASVAKVETTKQFRFSGVEFKFSELVTPEIKYHSPEELNKLLNDRITLLLQEKGLLSNQESMHKLMITVSYERHFVGEATPFPSDSLAYPKCAYKINVLDGSNIVASVERENLGYRGGMGMDLQVMAASLRDKKYEVEFIDAFADMIVERIERFN